MPHLAAGACRSFSVKVQLHVGQLTRGGPIRFAVGPEVAQQIRHRRRPQQFRRTQRQTADGAELLFELARDARVKRKVSGIVRTRRKLVDQEFVVVRQEEFHAEHADDLEPFKYCPCDLGSVTPHALGNVGRGDRQVENVVAVRVGDDAEVGILAVETARGDHGRLPT